MQNFRAVQPRARSSADYLFGINLSSALLLKAREQNYLDSVSVGRVQTPILGLVVRRYEANQNFTTAFFYKVLADIEINGQTLVFDVDVPDDAPVDDKGRIIDADYAQELQQKLTGQLATVTSVSHTPKKIAPPLATAQSTASDNASENEPTALFHRRGPPALVSRR
ncbi:hypothetical protein CDR68_16255 [Salmonella enterica]|nr:hypothetical protein [Salmonella enterica]